ncbi:MAG: hypothetical protein J6M18_01140 [Actinomycetaceae bacterium]|nr:hypothetical protein [Actinomycetaceae bacterium]
MRRVWVAFLVGILSFSFSGCFSLKEGSSISNHLTNFGDIRLEEVVAVIPLVMSYKNSHYGLSSFMNFFLKKMERMSL